MDHINIQLQYQQSLIKSLIDQVALLQDKIDTLTEELSSFSSTSKSQNCPDITNKQSGHVPEVPVYFCRPHIRKSNVDPSPVNFNSLNNPVKSPVNFQSRNVKCSWCGIPNHTERNCRRRLNLCFRCGSAKHFLNNCSYPSGYASESVQRKSNRSSFNKRKTFNKEYNGNGTTNKNFTVTDPFCSYLHQRIPDDTDIDSKFRHHFLDPERVDCHRDFQEMDQRWSSTAQDDRLNLHWDNTGMLDGSVPYQLTWPNTEEFLSGGEIPNSKIPETIPLVNPDHSPVPQRKNETINSTVVSRVPVVQASELGGAKSKLTNQSEIDPECAQPSVQTPVVSSEVVPEIPTRRVGIVSQITEESCTVVKPSVPDVKDNIYPICSSLGTSNKLESAPLVNPDVSYPLTAPAQIPVVSPSSCLPVISKRNVGFFRVEPIPVPKSDKLEKLESKSVTSSSVSLPVNTEINKQEKTIPPQKVRHPVLNKEYVLNLENWIKKDKKCVKSPDESKSDKQNKPVISEAEFQEYEKEFTCQVEGCTKLGICRCNICYAWYKRISVFCSDKCFGEVEEDHEEIHDGRLVPCKNDCKRGRCYKCRDAIATQEELFKKQSIRYYYLSEKRSDLEFKPVKRTLEIKSHTYPFNLHI